MSLRLIVDTSLRLTRSLSGTPEVVYGESLTGCLLILRNEARLDTPEVWIGTGTDTYAIAANFLKVPDGWTFDLDLATWDLQEALIDAPRITAMLQVSLGTDSVALSEILVHRGTFRGPTHVLPDAATELTLRMAAVEAAIDNVDNTSDAAKPVSVLQSAAISLASSSLTASVSTEALRATSAETSLASRISVVEVVNVAQGASLSTLTLTDTSLTSRLSTEEVARISADTSLSASVSAESLRATSAETSLTSRLTGAESVNAAQSASLSTLTLADTSLTSRISTEELAARAAEASVSAAASTALSSAVSTRVSAQAVLSTAVTSADTSLTSRISTEESTRASAAASISTAVSAEVSRATVAENLRAPLASPIFTGSVKSTGTTELRITSGGGVLGAELVDTGSWVSTGWTGDNTSGWVNGVSNTLPLQLTVPGWVAGNPYQIVVIKTQTAGGCGVWISGVENLASWQGTGTYTIGPVAGSSSANVECRPSSDFVGSIRILSVKRITPSISSISLADSGGVVASSLFAKGSNNALGYAAQYSLTTGNSNNALGHAAQYSLTTGGSNNALGYAAQYSLTTGGSNNALGHGSQYSLTTGNSNNALGYAAQYSLTTGGSNNALGTDSQRSLTTGNSNNALGHGSQYDITTGFSNSALGHNTGRGITTGSNNTILGAGVTGLSANLTDNVILATGQGTIRARFDAGAWALSGSSVVLTTGSAPITKLLTAVAALDFPSIAAAASSELTVSVSGAIVGASVVLGLPSSPQAGSVFQAFVSAADTVTVRATNITSSAIDPASASYRVTVLNF